MEFNYSKHKFGFLIVCLFLLFITNPALTKQKNKTFPKKELSSAQIASKYMSELITCLSFKAANGNNKTLFMKNSATVVTWTIPKQGGIEPGSIKIVSAPDQYAEHLVRKILKSKRFYSCHKPLPKGFPTETQEMNVTFLRTKSFEQAENYMKCGQFNYCPSEKKAKTNTIIAKQPLKEKTSLKKAEEPSDEEMYQPFMESLQKCIQDNWILPDSLKNNKYEEKAIVFFSVNKKGELIENSIITQKSSSPEIEESGIQAIKAASQKCFQPLPEGSAEQAKIDFTFTSKGKPNTYYILLH